MLLRWSTPPGTSDALDEPLRSLLTVSSLLPKAVRKAKGNSCAIERLGGQIRYGFLDLDGVHAPQTP